VRPAARSLALALAIACGACASAGADTIEGATAGPPPLRGTWWKLAQLGEAPVEPVGPQAEPHLVFARDALQVSGSGGCNRVAGAFELDGEKLRFGDLASTMMACERGMEQEQRFLQALQRVARYRIGGTRLELLDAQGALIAGLEAGEPR
jgi:heat shock protein HslJ